jgi:hypothetical protein
LVEPYTANVIPERERLWSFVVAGLLIVYGGYGVWTDDLYIPGRGPSGIHLHNIEAWLMYGAMLCGSVSLLSILIDHFDKRDNEQRYRIFERVVRHIGVALLCLSLGIAVYDQYQVLRIERSG